MDKICLVDMDGVLFDYESQLKEDLSKLKSPEEPEIENLWSENMPWIKHRMDLIKSQPGWWEKLPLYEPGVRLLQLVRKIGFTPAILTKGPTSKSRAWGEKVEAIKNHFGDMPINVVGESKGGVYGRVLIDDYPEYIKSWLEWRPRGLVIMPAHAYNESFAHENVIRYDDNIVEVRDALMAAFSRNEKEHWKENLKDYK